MIRIAVASNNGMVSEHFGHCEAYMIFDAENNQIVKTESFPSPGHRPGVLPNFLADQGVKVIISGGMGGSAITLFNKRDVEVIVGATGDAKSIVEKYLQGSLQSTGSVCHQHRFHNECEK